jgi:lipoprotein-anchoring transpeptidase ErfK/SrfK
MSAFQPFLLLVRFVAVLGVVLCAQFTLSSAASASQEVRQFDARSGKWTKKRIDSGKLRSKLGVAPIAARTVAYSEGGKAGSVVVDTGRRRLLYVNGDGTAIEYIIGVGREGFAWKGSEKISRKAEWPTWTPPAEMISREAKKGRVLPTSMEGGVENPLGARALYLGDTLYRIHGTNEPWTLGKAVSSGCIRMANDDIVDLYNKVRIGSLVVVK